MGDKLQVLQPDRGILYTCEGGQGEGITDRWLTDGSQDGRLRGSVLIDRDPSRAAFGEASLLFNDKATELTTVELPGTSQLGTSFTLAAMIRPTGSTFTRLFSNYRGSGPPWTSELIFDIDPSGKTIAGLRGVLNGGEVQTGAITFEAGRYHHVALTYADGAVVLFVDGREVGRGRVPAGPVLLGTNLRIGEDLDGAVNEQFTGSFDDILVVRRALTAGEIDTLARNGAQSLVDTLEPVARPVRPARVAISMEDR